MMTKQTHIWNDNYLRVFDSCRDYARLLLRQLQDNLEGGHPDPGAIYYQINKNNAEKNCNIGTLDYHDNEQEEVYDEIVEDEKYCRKKTEVAKSLSESSATNIYSKWPHDQDGERLLSSLILLKKFKKNFADRENQSIEIKRLFV
jgi:hypothetical protein